MSIWGPGKTGCSRSTKRSAARIGIGPKKWRRLHRLMYPVVLLGGLHFVMLAKGFQIEPLIYLFVILALLLLRLPKPAFNTASRRADSA